MSQRITYQPALDGVRAVSVIAVLLFHGGVGWMSGGYVGVSVFFTLSGFLITSLLLTEHTTTGTVDAGRFYTRRAKRLLPASLVCLAAVALLAAGGAFGDVANLRRDVIGALLQVFNWVKLASGESYADLGNAQAGVQNPLQHYWSLAIEEQFYWVWPLAVAGMLRVFRRGRPGVWPIAALTVLAVVVAPVIAAVWGADATYWSTPARISEILAGALVAALVLHRTVAPRVAALAPLGLLVIIACCVWFPAGRGPAYQGWFPAVAAASAALIAGLQAEGAVRTALAWTPLVAIGKVSYGVYLYHWPVFVLVDRHWPQLSLWPALLVKVAITAAVSVVSFVAIERPVRQSTWVGGRQALVGAFVGAAAVVAVVPLVPTADTFYAVDAAAAEQAAIDDAPVEPLPTLVAPPTSGFEPATVPATGAVTTSSSAAPTTTALLVPPRPVRIVVVGDSTAEATGAGLVQWAVANPALAQVSLVTGAGCGLVMGGFIELTTGTRDVDAECGPYVRGIVPDRVAELQPDVVMVMTTVWDVLDRQLTKGGPVLTPLDADLQQSMLASFAEFTDSLLAMGVPRVVWIQAPAPLPALFGGDDQQGDPARHEVMHTVISAVCADRPATRAVDLAGWLQGQPMADSRDFRSDGVHWTPEASLDIATRLLGPALVQAALT
jgi:peptidoglycan/LPS O-acetylase OafA/YrhL